MNVLAIILAFMAGGFFGFIAAGLMSAAANNEENREQNRL